MKPAVNLPVRTGSASQRLSRASCPRARSALARSSSAVRGSRPVLLSTANCSLHHQNPDSFQSHATFVRSFSSSLPAADEKPPLPAQEAADVEADLNPRWLSEMKARLGTCISYGINHENAHERELVVKIASTLANEWRGLTAGAQGFYVEDSPERLMRNSSNSNMPSFAKRERQQIREMHTAPPPSGDDAAGAAAADGGILVADAVKRLRHEQAHPSATAKKIPSYEVAEAQWEARRQADNTTIEIRDELVMMSPEESMASGSGESLVSSAVQRLKEDDSTIPTNNPSSIFSEMAEEKRRSGDSLVAAAVEKVKNGTAPINHGNTSPDSGEMAFQSAVASSGMVGTGESTFKLEQSPHAKEPKQHAGFHTDAKLESRNEDSSQSLSSDFIQCLRNGDAPRSGASSGESLVVNAVNKLRGQGRQGASSGDSRSLSTTARSRAATTNVGAEEDARSGNAWFESVRWGDMDSMVRATPTVQK